MTTTPAEVNHNSNWTTALFIFAFVRDHSAWPLTLRDDR